MINNGDPLCLLYQVKWLYKCLGASDVCGFLPCYYEKMDFYTHCYLFSVIYNLETVTYKLSIILITFVFIKKIEMFCIFLENSIVWKHSTAL